MTERCRVSVVIPTHHRERELGEAIRSVLDEDLDSFEVLVIDDSVDHSARSTVESFAGRRVGYLTMDNPTGGRPALVRNVGIQKARGNVLYFLDDDDRVHPGGLQALVQALESHPRTGVAFGRVVPFGAATDERERFARHFEWAAITARRLRWSRWLTAGVCMFRDTLVINSCCAIRRDLAVELGGYDPNVPLYEDVDFFTRGIRRGGHVFVDQQVLEYRFGQSSIIRNLAGDVRPIGDAGRLVHERMRTESIVRYRLLQITSKLLPIGRPDSAKHSM
jgi:glycosyltransferase involved in cell wall biosynthesis